MEAPKFFSQEELHALRVSIDACQQLIRADRQSHEIQPKDWDLYSQAQFLADVKLKEAKMWVGKMLEGLGSELPAQFRDKAEDQAGFATPGNEEVTDGSLNNPALK